MEVFGQSSKFTIQMLVPKQAYWWQLKEYINIFYWFCTHDRKTLVPCLFFFISLGNEEQTSDLAAVEG
uniref:Uncharacterized protein n=1 Tax=Megaselia scalaris TaxID=36166 RepID=T1GKD3_MEGSC